MKLQKLPIYPFCFVCGYDNPAGLQSQFYVDEEFVLLPVKFTEKHTGYPGHTHGGVVASALDETMAWSAARYLRRMCVTAEFTVRFIKRVPLEKELLVKTWVNKGHKLLVHTEGYLLDMEKNEILVRAWGKFMPISKEETQEINKFLIYDSDTENIF